MSRSMQLNYIPVTAFPWTDLFLDRIYFEWDSLNCTPPGAYEQEHATPQYFCRSIFIDRCIFRSNLLWMRLPWECHNQSQDTNWRHCVTGPELPFFHKRKGILKIDQSVKMPWQGLSMGVASSCSSAPVQSDSQISRRWWHTFNWQRGWRIGDEPPIGFPAKISARTLSWRKTANVRWRCVTLSLSCRRALNIFTADHVNLVPGFPIQENDGLRVAFYIRLPSVIARDGVIPVDALLQAVNRSKSELEAALGVKISEIKKGLEPTNTPTYPTSNANNATTVTSSTTSRGSVPSTGPTEIGEEANDDWKYIVVGVVVGAVIIFILGGVIYCV